MGLLPGSSWNESHHPRMCRCCCLSWVPATVTVSHLCQSFFTQTHGSGAWRQHSLYIFQNFLCWVRPPVACQVVDISIIAFFKDIQPLPWLDSLLSWVYWLALKQVKRLSDSQYGCSYNVDTLCCFFESCGVFITNSSVNNNCRFAVSLDFCYLCWSQVTHTVRIDSSWLS